MPPELKRPVELHQKEAAEIVGVSWQTLRLWRSKGYGPEWHYKGRRVVYFVDDLQAWFDRKYEPVDR